MASVGYLTLDCDMGRHSKCPGEGTPFGPEWGRGRRPMSTCQCVHHLPGVVFPDGIRGCVSPDPIRTVVRA
jgi:hypothetical protein